MYASEGAISLRDFCVEDIEFKVKWINDPQNNLYLHYDLPLEYNKTVDWFQSRNPEKRLDCIIEYDGTPVGLIGLLDINTVHSKAEFYITIGCNEYKQKGIATTATRLMLTYAFETLKMNKIYLNVDFGNDAACRLYEKVGMVCEGIFQEELWHRGGFIDRKRYAILRSNYMH